MTSTLPSPSAGQEREAFEDYARRDGMDVTHRVVDNGLTYLNSTTEHAWQFWQASRRHLPEINISRYDEADYGGMKPKAKGEWVRYEDMQEALARAALTSASKQEGGEPSEWQSVPLKPTSEMVKAGNKKTWPLPSQDVYRVMLAAAPQPPLAGAGEANMFWNDADPERSADSIHEVIEREWSDGLLQIGDVIEIQRAARLSNIRVELVPDPKDEDGFDYEIMPQSVNPKPAPLNGGCGDGESE